MKKIIILMISIIFMCIMLSGCGVENDSMTENRIQNNVYVPSSQVKNDVEKYLKDKYNKEFKASVSDSPNHIYSSYSVPVLDDENNSFDISITYQDEEHYSVTDRYNIYSMKHDFEKWFKELADPYIDCEFKVYWRPGIDDLSNDYNECKTVEDFLELSPTSSYYGLRFLIVLPSEEENSDIVTMTDSIATEMLEKQIRGQITTIIYVDDGIYEQINSKKDECFFGHINSEI